MNSIERTKAAIEFGCPDRPAICGGPHSDILQFEGYPNWLSSDWKYNDTIQKHERLDEWGCIHRIREICGSHYHVETHPLYNWAAYAAYKFPPLKNFENKIPEIRDLLANKSGGTKYIEAQMDPGPYLALTNLREQENMLMGFHDNMDMTITLYNRIVDYYISMVKVHAELGVHCATFFEDWGTSRGLICSPKMWREHFMPVTQRLVNAVHGLGLHFGWQVSGNVGEELLTYMAEMGVDLLNEYQPALKGLEVLRRTLKGKVCVMTCIDNVKTFEDGTVEDVRNEAERLIEGLDCNGAGLIFRPNGAGKNASDEIKRKAEALWEVVYRHCKVSP